MHSAYTYDIQHLFRKSLDRLVLIDLNLRITIILIIEPAIKI